MEQKQQTQPPQDAVSSQTPTTTVSGSQLTSKDKMNSIIECLKNTSLKDSETTEKAFNNLTVLAREQSPAVVFEHPHSLTTIKESLEKSKGDLGAVSITKSCFRLISELCKMSVERTILLMDVFTIDYITDIVCYSTDKDLLTSYQYLVQSFINTLAGVQETAIKIMKLEKEDKERTKTVSESLYKKVNKKVDEDRLKDTKAEIFGILMRLVRRASSYIISAQARDCVLGIIMSNIDYQGLNFGVELVSENCLQNLLDIASEVEELKNASSMEITPMTHTLVSAVLEKIYSCHDHDKVREIFRQKVQSYLDTKLRNQDMDDKTRVAKLFTVLLHGPAEIGNSCIGQTGMVEMLIAMASSDDFGQQKAALDAIIAAASKKDKCAAFAKFGENVLNNLRESKNEDIKLRALVGLSKISSVGSTDAFIRPLGKDANINFARDCKTIISRPTPEFKLKQYAIEALAFLSFDGDVKEELVADKSALQSLYETLTFDSNSPVVYSILTIFVNLTNSYDKQETSPELIELAKFAQQHIPQQHPKDSKEAIEERIARLALTDLVPNLVQVTNNTSKSIKELLARIVNAMCEYDKLRGRIIQQGVVKLLMELSRDDSKPPERYTLLAAQALARLSITINPEFVFPGQKMIAAIKPIRKLLGPDCTSLQNFEGLLSLTNIAQASADARIHLLRDNGYSQIEALMFEEHTMIRRAAVQCLVNLIKEDQVISLYESENDRVKYLVILCQEEDIETVKAASGALAMLCQVSEKSCERIFSAKQWYEILMLLLSSGEVELIHRAAVIVHSIVHCSNVNIAEKIFESKVFEVLLALTLPQVDTVPQLIKDIITECLKEGKRRNLIRDTVAGNAGIAMNEDVESSDED